MSVKLHDGFQLGNMSLTELMGFTQRLRERINQEADRLYVKLSADGLAALIDFASLLNEDELLTRVRRAYGDGFSLDESPSTVITLGVYNKVKDAIEGGKRNPRYNLSASVTYMPVSNKILAVFFSDQPEYRRVWRDMPEVREYGYWDNTDPPANVTKREWRQRYEDWKEALNDFGGTPIENGLTAKFVSVPPYKFIHEIVPHVPSFEYRVDYIAKWLTVEERYAASRGTSGTEGGEATDWVAYSDTLDWLKTDEGKAVVVEKRKWVAERIPKTIDRETVDKPLREFLNR